MMPLRDVIDSCIVDSENLSLAVIIQKSGAQNPEWRAG
jgi:hypothetical protein